MDNITIDLSDLFHRILKKWIIVVCFALIFAFLLGAYGYNSALKANESANEMHRQYAEAAPDLPGYYNEELFRLRSGLSDNAAAFAEAYAGIYRNFLAEYQDGEASDKESLTAYMMFLDSYKDVISVMSSTQREYYEMLISSDGNAEGSAPVPPFEASQPSMIQPKWILIGAVLGMLIACVCVALPYLASGKLRTAKDLELAFGVPVLASVDKAGKAELDVISSGIADLIRNGNYASALLFSNAKAPDEAVCTGIAEKLEKAGVSVSTLYTGAGEADLVQNMSAANAAVLLEKIGKSKYTDIRDTIEKCRAYGVQVLGSIVMK